MSKNPTFLQATMATMTFTAFERFVRAGGQVTLRMDGRNFVVECNESTKELKTTGSLSLLATATDAALVLE